MDANDPTAPIQDSTAAAEVERLTPQEESRVTAVMAIASEQEAEKLAALDAASQQKASIFPSVMRPVWYSPHPDEAIYTPHQVLGAVITSVLDERTVNLAVFDAEGRGPHPRQRVSLFDGDSAPTPPGTWMWMPYQKGQAAKTEATHLDAMKAHVAHVMADGKAEIEKLIGEFVEVVRPILAKLPAG